MASTPDVEMTAMEAGGAPAVEKENPFGRRSRLSMFILLSAIAGSSLMFGAKEQQAEDKVWKQDMKVVRNGTSVAEQKPMRYTTVAKMSWEQGARACQAYGGTLCKWNDVCTKGVSATKRLCPDQSCVGLETPAKQNDRLIPISGRAPGTFARVNDCSTTVLTLKKETTAVVACCGTVKMDGSAYSKGERHAWEMKQKQQARKGAAPKGLPGKHGIMPIHQAPIIQRAVMKGKISVLPTKPAKGGANKGNVGGGSVGVAKVGTAKKGDSKGIWQVQDHIRKNDPFMKAKKSGSKPMQSFHSHIAKHLGNETVSSVTKHFNSFTSGMANLVKSMKTNVKLENKNQTATHGSVSHHLRESDPFMKKDHKGDKQKTKVAPLHKALNSTDISKHAKALGDHFQNVMGSFTSAAHKAIQSARSAKATAQKNAGTSKAKKTESLRGLKDEVAVEEEKDDKKISAGVDKKKASSASLKKPKLPSKYGAAGLDNKTGKSGKDSKSSHGQYSKSLSKSGISSKSGTSKMGKDSKSSHSQTSKSKSSHSQTSKSKSSLSSTAGWGSQTGHGQSKKSQNGVVSKVGSKSKTGSATKIGSGRVNKLKTSRDKMHLNGAKGDAKGHKGDVIKGEHASGGD